MDGIGKTLIFIGAAVIILGLAFMLAPKMPFIGRLPGDIMLKRGDATFYFPLATSIIVSILITVLLNIAFRLFR